MNFKEQFDAAGEKLRRIVGATPDYGAALLTNLLVAHLPFLYLRFGDGFLECVAGKEGMTCDLEPYTPALASELLRIWHLAIPSEHLILGDWQTASFTAEDEYSRYTEQWAALIGDHTPTRIHFESLLLMRESRLLVDFYRTVKADTRKKLYMGPEANRGAAKMLGADFLPTPMTNAWAWRMELKRELMRREFDVLLYGCGMVGNIPVVDCWKEHPERTFINLGSAMDPIFMGRSRRQQLLPDTIRKMFAELL